MRLTVLSDHSVSVILGIERVHQQERDLATVFGVQVLRIRSGAIPRIPCATYLDLSDLQVEEGQTVSNFNDTLGTDTAHGRSETTVQADDGQLVENLGVDAVNLLVREDVLGAGRVNSVPVAGRQSEQAYPAKRLALTAFHLVPFPARIG